MAKSAMEVTDPQLTQYGDEDPEFKDDTDPEYEKELFETAKYLGWKPSDIREKGIAARYQEWLKKALPEE